MWRAEDEDLLARLTDERVLERLWGAAAPGAPPLPARASGLVRLMRARSGDAVARAERGEPGTLLAAATPARLADLPAALAHHLVLFHRARAEHLIARRDAKAEAAIDRSLAIVIAGWLALAREREHVRAIARAAIGEDVDPAAIATRGLEVVAAIAREGAIERGPGHARALAALSRIDEAIDSAGVPRDAAIAAAAQAHARAARAAIADALIAPVAIELDELAAREWTPPELGAALERAALAWRWAGEEPELERAVVRELPRFAWDLYRARRWDDLRAIVRPIEPLIDRLTRRIRSDPAELPWAAQCAQAMIFRAELASTLEAQITLAERGLEICPTLRNARLVLADLLCARAERRIDQPLLVRGPDALVEAGRDVARAIELFPDLKRLPALRERLGRHVPDPGKKGPSS